MAVVFQQRRSGHDTTGLHVRDRLVADVLPAKHRTVHKDDLIHAIVIITVEVVVDRDRLAIVQRDHQIVAGPMMEGHIIHIHIGEGQRIRSGIGAGVIIGDRIRAITESVDICVRFIPATKCVVANSTKEDFCTT